MNAWSKESTARLWGATALVISVCLSVLCGAATIAVDPTGGGDHTTIQPAIDAARPQVLTPGISRGYKFGKGLTSILREVDTFLRDPYSGLYAELRMERSTSGGSRYL